MISIQDFITYLKGLGVNTPIYPDAFPTTSPMHSMTIEIGQGFSSSGDVADITLTMTLRDKSKGKAEKTAQEINTLLANKTNQNLGDSHQIILIKSQQLLPSYLGKDAGNRHYYMNNFRVLIT